MTDAYIICHAMHCDIRRKTSKIRSTMAWSEKCPYKNRITPLMNTLHIETIGNDNSRIRTAPLENYWKTRITWLSCANFIKSLSSLSTWNARGELSAREWSRDFCHSSCWQVTCVPEGACFMHHGLNDKRSLDEWRTYQWYDDILK